MSKTTIYKRRKRGAMLLQQLDRIESQLQHQAAKIDELLWAERFGRAPSKEGQSTEEQQTRTKP